MRKNILGFCNLFDSKTKIAAKTLYVAAALLLLTASLPSFLLTNKAEAFSGAGFGSSLYPFRISTCEQLQEINDNDSARYVLVNDVDCTGTVEWNDGDGFEPIDEFTGTLDGRNFTIDGLTVNRSGEEDLGGLFNYVEDAIIANLYFTNLSVSYSDGSEIGGLVGEIDESTVHHVFVSGDVSGTGRVGGLFGNLEDSTIHEVAFSGTVTNTGAWTGGIAASMEDSTLTNSFVNATIAGNNTGGGLVGELTAGSGSSVTNSYATGSIQDNNMAAGLIGDVEPGGDILLENLFTTMLTTKDSEDPEGSALVAFDFSEGNVTYTNNFFDASKVTSETHCVVDQVPVGCTAVNTDGEDPDHFKNSDEVNPLDTWDFDDIWQKTSGYPILREMTLSALAPIPSSPGGTISTCQQLSDMRYGLDEAFTLSQDLDCGFNPGDILYEEDFESSLSGWASSGDGDSWNDYTQTCENEEVPGSPFDFGSTVMGTYGNAGPDCEYDNDETSTLLGPTISLPADENLYLQVDSYGYDEGGDCQDGFDNKAIAVTTNGGDTFSILNDCYGLHPGIAGDSGLGDALDFRTLRFDLSPYAGQDIRLGFLYETEDSCCDTELGWFVDNIIIGEGLIMQPIGSQDNPFIGSFDGDGHSISHLNIYGGEDSGLFGYIGSGAEIRNLNLVAGEVSSFNDTTGGLAGVNEGLIENSTYTGVVNGDDEVGGLVGYNQGEIRYSSADVELMATDDEVGGLVGYNEGAIEASFASGSVSGPSEEPEDFGGLVGYNEGEITDTFADVAVSGHYTAGGLVGYSNGEVSRSYASGSVSGLENLGGLVGYNEGLIDNSFAVTDVNPDEEAQDVGGLVGASGEGEITNSYYDMERSLTYCTLDGADPDPDGCTGVNGENSQPNYFINNTTNPPLDQWDFEEVWLTRSSDFPVLRAFVADTEDLNGDGTPDSEQPQVSGYISPITGKIVVIDVGEGCELTTDDITREANLEKQDPAYDFANGLFEFEADCEEATTTVRFFYYGVHKKDLVVRKYNPNTHAFFNLTGEYGATLEETTINGSLVTIASYEITDGGVLDMDGEVNGTIVDPVGIASNVLGAPSTGFGRF